MQPPTETTPPARGDEAELYRRHHGTLRRAVAHAVNAPQELIEGACQTAWAILLRTQPDRYAIFAWLRVVAIHEAYRLKAIERRETRLASLRADQRNDEDLVADPAHARRRARRPGSRNPLDRARAHAPSSSPHRSFPSSRALSAIHRACSRVSRHSHKARATSLARISCCSAFRRLCSRSATRCRCRYLTFPPSLMVR
jgi:hypothetical protein